MCDPAIKSQTDEAVGRKLKPISQKKTHRNNNFERKIIMSQSAMEGGEEVRVCLCECEFFCCRAYRLLAYAMVVSV